MGSSYCPLHIYRERFPMSNSTEQKLNSIFKMLAQKKIMEAIKTALQREGIEEPTDEQVAEALNSVFDTPEMNELAAVLTNNLDAIKWFKKREPELYEDLRQGPSLNSTVAIYINEYRRLMAQTACLKLIDRVAPSDVTLKDCEYALSN